jgi:hypothetical protein
LSFCHAPTPGTTWGRPGGNVGGNAPTLRALAQNREDFSASDEHIFGMTHAPSPRASLGGRILQTRRNRRRFLPSMPAQPAASATANAGGGVDGRHHASTEDFAPVAF